MEDNSLREINYLRERPTTWGKPPSGQTRRFAFTRPKTSLAMLPTQNGNSLKRYEIRGITKPKQQFCFVRATLIFIFCGEPETPFMSGRQGISE